MSLNTSLYSLLRNRIVRDAIPQEVSIASYMDLFSGGGEADTDMGEVPYDLIECGIAQCRVLNDVSPVPEDVERCN